MPSRPRHPRGFTLVYAVILMVALTGFCSFAVDYGRCQVVKMQLHRTADAAARAAVANVASGITAVQNAAIAVAALNSADGSAVALDANTDIDFGTWTPATKTFTVLSGSARSTATALRITARRTVPLVFAQLAGKSSASVTAVAIAYATAATPASTGAGFVGLSSFTNSGNTTDSYDGSAGTYASQAHGAKGNITSNSDLTLWSCTINGNARPGVGKSIQGGSITGTHTNLPSAVSYSAAAFPSSNNNSNIASVVNYSNGSWNGTDLSTYSAGITLPGGTYVFGNMNISGPVVFTGPAKLYVTNQCNVNGSGYLGTYQSKPANLTIYCNGSLNLYTAAQPYYMDIFSPLAAINMSPGGSQFYGQIIVKDWAVYNMNLHFDTSLPDHSPSGGGFTSSGSSSGSAGAISLVN